MEQSNKIRVGIMPQEQIRQRMLAIANGTYKPEPDDPKIWLTSTHSLTNVLNNENQAFFDAIGVGKTVNESDSKPVEFDGFRK